jgi:hypothetical protein
MLQVAELSKEIIEEFRDERKGRLKRTFVGADEAVAARYKKT